MTDLIAFLTTCRSGSLRDNQQGGPGQPPGAAARLRNDRLISAFQQVTGWKRPSAGPPSDRCLSCCTPSSSLRFSSPTWS